MNRCSSTTDTGNRAVVGMWDIERQHPWRWAGIYAAVLVFSMLAAHATAQGWW